MKPLKIDELPRDPSAALELALAHGIARCGAGNAKIEDVKKSNFAIYNDLFVTLKIARASAERHSDAEFRSLAGERLQLVLTETMAQVGQRFSQVFEAFLTTNLQDHFLAEDDQKDFDEAALSEDDKITIAKHLDDAREIARNSLVLPAEQIRRICLRIAKAESELFKEKAGYAAFLAAAFEASGLVKQFGKDVQPLADAVEKARTKTQKRVEGYARLEKNEDPKRLPKPD